MAILLSLYLFIVIITIPICAYLAWYAWMQAHIQGARLLALALLCAVEVHLCYLGLSFSNDAATGYFWTKLRYLGAAFVSYFFFLFVIEYTNWQLSKGLLLLLGIFPLATQVFMWTALEQYYFLNWRLYDLGLIRIDVNVYHGLFLIQFGSANFFLFTAFFRLLHYVFHIESRKRMGIWWLIFGALMARLFSLPDLMSPQLHWPDLLPIGFLIWSIGIGLSLFRYDFFRAIPIAYDLVVQNIRAAVFVLNPYMQILQTNPYAESLLEASKEKLSQRSILEVFQQYFGQDFPAHTEEYIWEFQQSSNDKPRYYEATISSLKRGSFVAGYLLTIRDMSIYKEAEAQALALSFEKERRRLLSEFVTYTSHDLRTPLSMINSAVYILQRTEDSERRGKALERISEQSAHIDKLLGQFHSFLELETGDSQKLSKISIQELLNRKAEKYRPLISKYQIDLHYTAPQRELFVKADIEYLRQAIQALIENAILYNQAEGEIFLEAQEKAGHVHIIIRDTGMGIAPEKLKQIFQSFYKGNEARTSDGSGAGLGLALVQRVAKLYEGEIEIESEVGKGTKASLILPLSL